MVEGVVDGGMDVEKTPRGSRVLEPLGHEETAALPRLLTNTIDADRYPQVAGTFAGLAMALNGIATAALVPLIINLRALR